MPGFLRQSTASQVIELGPFIDDTDFKTAKTALTIANTDITLRKAGGTTHVSKNSGGGTHIANGFYSATLDATDTSTVGLLDVHCKMTAALIVFDRYWVLEEAIYDALMAASAAGFDASGRVDVGKVLGTAQTARDLGASVLLAVGTGTGQVNLSAGAVPVTGDLTATMKTSVTTAASASTPALSAGGVTAIWAGVVDSAGVTTLLARLSAVRAGYLDNLSAGAVALASSLSALVTTVGTAGAGLTAIATQVWANATRVLTAGTNIVLAKGTGVTGFTDLDASGVRTAVGLASANLDTQLDAVPTNADLATALGTADDAVLAAIAALPVPLTAAGIRTAVGLATANLDTQLGDLPTNAELATALGTADDAVLAAIAALPTPLTASALRAAIGLATANLDTQLDALPTNGELATALAAADDAVLAAIAALPTPLTAASVRSALGLASANLDTQLAALPTAAVNADAVWDEALSGHLTGGSTGASLNGAGAAGDPWTASLPGSYGAGTAGQIIGGNLNATVSSRALESSLQTLIATIGAAGAGLTAIATAVWASATRVLTAGTNIVLAKGTGLTGLNDLSAAQVNTEADAALADVGLTTTVTGRVDAPVSSRLASGNVSADVIAIKAKTDALPAAAAPTAAAVAAQVRTELTTELGRLDAPVSSRLASGTVAADVALVKAKTDLIPASPAAVGNIPTAVQIADAWLTRDMAAVTGEAARSPLNALRFNRNKFTIVNGVLTVFKEDDTTPAWTAALTTTAGDPVSASDPA